MPVAQFTPAARRRLKPVAPSTISEVGALARLLVNPAMCLETALLVNPIRAVREAAEITQSDLAFALRISQPMLSRQEQPLREREDTVRKDGERRRPPKRKRP